MAVTERVGDGAVGGGAAAAGAAPMTAGQPGQGRVFISYSRKDKAFVQRLHDALKARGLGTWVDWEGIPLSADWLLEIYGGIEAADTVVFVISPESAASTVCQQELAHAVANHKRLIPVVYRDVAGGAVPPALASLNWIFFRETDNFDTAFDALIGAIETDLDWVRAHTRLLVRAIEWEQKGRNGSLLVRGADLREAEDWLARAGDQKGIQPTTLQTQYLLAGRRAETRRQRTILASLVAFVVLVGVAGIVALLQRNEAVTQRQAADVAREQETVQRQEAERQRGEAERQRAEAERQQVEAERQRDTAQARELAANSVSQLEADPELSLLLASASLNRAPTDQGDVALQRALVASRVRRVLRGHTDQVQRAIFSPDGTWVATASNDGTARVWDTATGASVATMAPPLPPDLTAIGRALSELAFSPDGRLLVTTGFQQPSARVWNAATGQQIAELAGSDRINGVGSPMFSPDGSLLLLTHGDQPPGLWQTSSWTRLRSLPVPGGRFVTVAAFSPDGKIVAGGGVGSEIFAWSAATGAALGALRGHEANVSSIQFSPDGKLILSASDDGTARVWDLAGDRDVVLRGHNGKVLTAAFNPTGTLVVTGSDDRTARVWDAKSGRLVAVLSGHLGLVKSVAFSRDGRLIVTGSQDKTAVLWTADGNRVASLGGHADTVNSTVFSPDGRLVLTGSGDDTARLWETTSSRPYAVPRAVGQNALAVSPNGLLVVTGGGDGVARILASDTGNEVAALRGHRGAIRSVSFGPDGSTVVSIGDDGTARVWDTAGARQLAELPVLRPGTSPKVAGFSPDGQRVVTAGLDAAQVWDWRAVRVVATLANPTPKEPLPEWARGVADARFSPDGTLVATGSNDGHIRVWDAATGTQHVDLQNEGLRVTGLAFSPDGGGLLARGEEESIVVWSTRTWQPVTTLTGFRGLIVAATFSPNNRFILTGSQSKFDQDNLTRIWEVATGKVVTELRGHSSGISDAAFSPDGKWVVTGSLDGTARVWEVATGRSAMELSGPGGELPRVVFGPDNRLIAALAAADGKALLYRCTVCAPREELLALAAANVTRDLTPDERARYVP